MQTSALAGMARRNMTPQPNQSSVRSAPMRQVYTDCDRRTMFYGLGMCERMQEREIRFRDEQIREVAEEVRC
jgi:hypothetical protein